MGSLGACQGLKLILDRYPLTDVGTAYDSQTTDQKGWCNIS